METKSEVPRTFDDLVFENRNKDYGAYVIRRAYDENVNKAFFLTILAGMFLAVAVFGISSIKGTSIIDALPPNNGSLTKLTLDPKIEMKQLVKKVETKSKVTPEKVIPVVTTADVPETEVITTTEVTSVATTTGTENGVIEIADSGGSPDGSTQSLVTPVEKPKTPVVIAEKMPRFPGGEEALIKFLQKNLKYPRRAAVNETQGNVFVSFVIDTDGKVIATEIIKGISRECDEEAKRVILAMPDWEPGMQNKMPVMVKMVLPIKFKLNS